MKYKPLARKLNIVMPVKFMGRTNLNDGSDKPIDSREPLGSMSSRIPEVVKNAYKSSVRRVWSKKHKLYLNAIFPEKIKSCYDWAYISPVEVCVSINEEPKNADAYKVYYVNREGYRNATGRDRVIFSKDSYKKRYADRNDVGQNLFAHEFGHQVGLGDEYAVDREAIVGGRRFKHVYWNPRLTAYDRELGIVRHYNLASDTMIHHNRKDYDVAVGTDDNRKTFYYLKENNNWKSKALDGMYTRHTQMVADEFGEEYANKNATMYDYTENSLGLETSIMNGKGNEVKPHHYITFKEGMVRAIQSDYGLSPSLDAPNMSKDWKIE